MSETIRASARRTDNGSEQEGERQAMLLMDHFREENPGVEKSASHIRGH